MAHVSNYYVLECRSAVLRVTQSGRVGGVMHAPTSSKKRVFCSTFMGLTRAWLPSLRSLLSHLGVAVICLSGHVLSGMLMGLNGLFCACRRVTKSAQSMLGLPVLELASSQNSLVFLGGILEHRHGGSSGVMTATELSLVLLLFLCWARSKEVKLGCTKLAAAYRVEIMPNDDDLVPGWQLSSAPPSSIHFICTAVHKHHHVADIKQARSCHAAVPLSRMQRISAATAFSTRINKQDIHKHCTTPSQAASYENGEG